MIVGFVVKRKLILRPIVRKENSEVGGNRAKE